MAQEEEVLGKAYDSRLMKRLLQYLRPYKWQVGISLGSILLKAGADVLGPYLVASRDRSLPGAGSRAAHRSDSLSEQPIRYVGIAQIAAMYVGLHRLQFSARLPADLFHAVGRADGDVRSAQPDFPPPAAHAHRVLRQESGRPPGHARHVRRGRAERNVHLRRGFDLRRRFRAGRDHCASCCG